MPNNMYPIMQRTTGSTSPFFCFLPFKAGAAIFGAHFGDEGKGKLVDILARDYKERSYKVLSVRGQGSGNAGHTVVVDGKKYDFHYLTSAGLSADLMLLGAGMLIDPIRVLEEAKKLPAEKRDIICIDERATMCCDIERQFDAYIENTRSHSGLQKIGTTKSGVGPAEAFRRLRIHLTFADVKKMKSPEELYETYKNIPLLPNEIKETMTKEYANQLFLAINSLNIVNSQCLLEQCRQKGDWAVLLEVSQAMSLDPFWGNSGHFVTSTPCSDIGAAAGAGLTMYDFPDGSYMIAKAYASKVGGGPFITKFTAEDKKIADFIYEKVGETGVTTGRKRDLGYFDAVAIRMAVARTGCTNLCINCMDVIGQIPGGVTKICYAYREKSTGIVVYNSPYHICDYEPVYVDIRCNWNIDGYTDVSQLPKGVFAFIHAIEYYTGTKVRYIGTGPSSKDFIKLS